MTTFDHVIVLLSFVYAIALTHLLSRIGTLINAHRRVKWSGLLALIVTNATVALVMNWLTLLTFRNQSDWTVLDAFVQLANAIALYFLCYVALPETPQDGTIDLEAVYWSQRRTFYTVALVGLVVALLDNLEFLKTPNASHAMSDSLGVLVLAPPDLLALFRRERWAQWLGGLGSFAIIGVLTPITYWQLS